MTQRTDNPLSDDNFGNPRETNLKGITASNQNNRFQNNVRACPEYSEGIPQEEEFRNFLSTKLPRKNCTPDLLQSIRQKINTEFRNA